jgi:hypothetical protein
VTPFDSTDCGEGNGGKRRPPSIWAHPQAQGRRYVQRRLRRQGGLESALGVHDADAPSVGGVRVMAEMGASHPPGGHCSEPVSPCGLVAQGVRGASPEAIIRMGEGQRRPGKSMQGMGWIRRPVNWAYLRSDVKHIVANTYTAQVRAQPPSGLALVPVLAEHLGPADYDIRDSGVRLTRNGALLPPRSFRATGTTARHPE